jgi:ABC-2 type transport system ATP-binding protein
VSDEPAVRVRDLEKTFQVPVREAGLRAALRSLVRRTTRTVRAVAGISFDVRPGEIVGFLGPNGAGKTTTLKMLSGLLHPTSGEARVLGHVPHLRERDYLSRITLVMGQRNQLLWDIPVIDSFERNRAIYRISRADYQRSVDEITELLGLEELLCKPARNLSLGERMKCEVAVALLHRPRVLFLDEPTIGLDVTMQRRIRDFIAEYNRRTGATVLLTSHYMADVEALCRRVIVIDRGSLLIDTDLPSLVERFASHRTIRVDLASKAATGDPLGAPVAGRGDGAPPVDLSCFGEVIRQEPGRIWLRAPRVDTPRITAKLLAELPVLDLTVEPPPLEDVIAGVFSERRT